MPHPAEIYIFTRDVTVDECPWLDEPIAEGDVWFPYHGHTYGCIDERVGVAASKVRDETPFLEVPKDAVRSAWESDPA